jgi:SAM-dependent methyltransferase
MHASDDDYRGLCAATWDLWRDDTADWSDRHLYLDLVHRFGQPALDLGCGTGRLILDYLALGLDVDGIEPSPEMLDICRQKAAGRSDIDRRLFEQRVQELALPRKYRTIIAPSSVLQLVTDPAAARQAMRRIYDHLQPGGALVASFGFECRPGDPLDTGWELLFEKPRPDGALVRCMTRERRDPATQLWHTEQTFEVIRDSEIIEREHRRQSPEGRWYTQAQAAELFTAAGLVNVYTLHDFTKKPAMPTDRFFCVVGQRAQ